MMKIQNHKVTKINKDDIQRNSTIKIAQDIFLTSVHTKSACSVLKWRVTFLGNHTILEMSKLSPYISATMA